MLSIIIPVLNQHEMTRECLEAIHENTSDYEIILVDNGSDPPIDGATIRNETNLGYPVAVNHGIAKSKGEIICLMNNDVVVSPGWAEGLISGLDHFAIVGPVTNYCAGIQMIGIPAYYDKQDLYRIVPAWSKRRAGMRIAVNWLIGFCFMFRRSLYDKLGPFDESLWPCSGEELDFCLHARSKGYRVGIIQDVYVHHEGSATFNKTMKEQYNDILTRNEKRVAAKWGKDFWKKQIVPPGKDSENGAGLRLNLGCGPHKLKGFINIDQLERVKPDIIADVLDMPYDNSTVDEIYAGHLLEHFPYSEGVQAVHYWHSLLKEGGTIGICVPNYDDVVKEFIKEPTAERLKSLNDQFIYGTAIEESPHRFMYNEELLKKVMEEAGFVELKRMPIDHPYFPMPVIWQVGYQGKKL